MKSLKKSPEKFLDLLWCMQELPELEIMKRCFEMT